MNLIVAYSCGFRAGALGFHHTDNSYGDWTHYIEFEGGWSTDGTTFGVSGWIDEHFTSDPPDMFTENGALVKGGVTRSVMTAGNRIGWPLQCFQSSGSWLEIKKLRSRAESKGRGILISETETEITPTPHWYYKGIQTGLNNSVLYRIPVQIRPLHFLFNTVFWASAWVSLGVLWHGVRTHRRKRRGLCLACGYAVEDLQVCPECGSEHPGATTRRGAAQ